MIDAKRSKQLSEKFFFENFEKKNKKFLVDVEKWIMAKVKKGETFLEINISYSMSKDFIRYMGMLGYNVFLSDITELSENDTIGANISWCRDVVD